MIFDVLKYYHILLDINKQKRSIRKKLFILTNSQCLILPINSPDPLQNPATNNQTDKLKNLKDNNRQSIQQLQFTSANIPKQSQSKNLYNLNKIYEY